MTGKPPAKKSSQDGQLSETREAMKSNNIPARALYIYVCIISCEGDFSSTEDRTGRKLVEDLCSVV